jgi:uncharacterized protein YukE
MIMLDTPPSDPAAVLAFAARVRLNAERVHAQLRRLDARVDALNFEGPAAVRLHADMAERKVRAHRVAEDLEDVAQLVLRDLDLA